MSYEARLIASLRRVLDGRGRSVGTAFHLTPHLCCTCAHVVAAALGVERLNQPPPDTIHLADPVDAARLLDARVRHLDSAADLAILECLHPPPDDFAPLPIIAPVSFAGRACQIYGFPSGYPAGRQAHGMIAGLMPGGLLQLFPTHAGTWIEAGFSGGPVWDVAGQGVVGVVQAVSPHDAWAAPLAAVLPAGLHPVEPPADVYTTARLAHDLTAQGFVPLTQLAITPDDAATCQAFDFIGARWNATFAFTIALIRGDGTTPEALTAALQWFANLNNRFFRDPHLFKIGILERWLTFNLSGLLCVVFEAPVPETTLLQTVATQFPSLTYSGNLFEPGFQTSATTLCWAVDLSRQRLQKQTGRQSLLVNAYVHWTNQALREIEALLRDRM